MRRPIRLPPYTHGFVDRHGKPRFYFRRAGFPRVALPGLPWSPEFMATHEAAMAGECGPRRSEVGMSLTQPGTVAALAIAYFNTPEFANLKASTQATYRGIIEAFVKEHGEKRVALLGREHVATMIAKKQATKSAANNLLRMLRILMQFAVATGIRKTDPTIGIKPLKVASDGFHTWTEDEISAFEAKHPLGTRARLAFALLLYSAQRRGDVVRMGRQHVRQNVLSITQEKTGTLVEIPVHSQLQAAIGAGPTGSLTFLVTETGKSFTAAGFGNWFHKVCADAELECCSAHGLRKAASRRLAEAGCTAHEIMAITGHKTLKEVTRYTAAVDRRRLAHTAMQKVKKGTPSGKPH